MNIVVCHNFYQRPGGEDQVFADETALLESRGHRVVRYTLHNDAVNGSGGKTGRLGLVRDTVWNGRVYDELRGLVRRERAEVVHFHNTFPLMSPAAWYAARRAGAAVVQTLHNYRLACPGSLFLRDGEVCEKCLGKSVPWPGAVHKCYRGDAAASAVTVGMLALHRAAGTYRRAVDLYISLTEFGRRKYVEARLPADKIVVKPNFVGTDRGIGDGRGDERGPFGLFVGRLDVGKGLEVVLGAWSRLAGPARLVVLGDGPLAPLVKEASGRDARIEWRGRQPMDEVYRVMGQAAFLIMPSVWYEAMPRTLVESYSKGTPILASGLGAMAELIEPGRTGLHFTPGSETDLADKVRWAFDHPGEMGQMRRIARQTFEERYTADENYRLMCQIYARAVEHRWSARRSPKLFGMASARDKLSIFNPAV